MTKKTTVPKPSEREEAMRQAEEKAGFPRSTEQKKKGK